MSENKLQLIQNRNVHINGVRETPTVKVIHIASNRNLIIPLGQFNSKAYKLQPGANIPDVAPEPVEDENDQPMNDGLGLIKEYNSSYPREELVVMNVDALKLLPEWARTSQRQRDKCKDKDDVVELIVAMRA